MSERERKMIWRNSGVQRGHIRRMVSPSFGGDLTKPFVLLDYYDEEAKSENNFSFHSHSGIATLSYLLEGELYYEDSAGGKGTLPAGSVEWLVSGGGAWHKAGYANSGRAHGIQLWMALPAIIEDGESSSQYIRSEDIPIVGAAKVLMGELEGKKSPIHRTSPMNLFHVEMKPGEAWKYQPPLGYEVAWVFAYEGSLLVAGEELQNELGIFEKSEGLIRISAGKEGVSFLFGSAVTHPYPLVVAHDTIHTNQESLEKAEVKKEEIQQILIKAGRI